MNKLRFARKSCHKTSRQVRGNLTRLLFFLHKSLPMPVNTGRQPFRIMVYLALLVLLTLSVLHPHVHSHSNQGHAHQLELSSLTTAMDFSDVDNHEHGHNQDSTDPGNEHSPFDHSHETQHPPHEVRHKNLMPLAVWSNTYMPVAFLADYGRLERPPRSLLIA